ncbi:MAG: ZIP family metal transporter [Desulfococcaceae bacterium]
MSPILTGTFASLVAGAATGIGALPALKVDYVPDRIVKTTLGFAAGVMLAASSFSLVVPGIEHGDKVFPRMGVFMVLFGLAVGGLFLHLIDSWLPEDAFLEEGQGPADGSLRRLWLFIIAITLHNFPEGLAVGVGYGTGEINAGVALTAGIALQNMPEGLAVALPLVGIGYPAKKAIWIATLTGLVEPVGGFLGVSAVTLFHPVLPVAMGFAAGAMLFVICDQIISDIHGEGRNRPATFALLVGFGVMTLLDTLLG